ncbi:hypothetical protein NBRC116188_24640 [Oceaniserpentilla sp. 4NH20-0058]|uniref:hypothetical protein n=1 Tax=Oceaniserpentilla sp. 4NH20-0058 TaxID=3127660 RepID=UPI0031071D67
MALIQASPSQVTHSKSASLATILPANTPMPICCDQCDHEQTYTMTQLRKLPTLSCKACGDSRAFSHFELTVVEKTLNELGYYLQKTA